MKDFPEAPTLPGEKWRGKVKRSGGPWLCAIATSDMPELDGMLVVQFWVNDREKGWGWEIASVWMAAEAFELWAISAIARAEAAETEARDQSDARRASRASADQVESNLRLRAEAAERELAERRPQVARLIEETNAAERERDAAVSRSAAAEEARIVAVGEVEMLRGVGCSENGDGPCGVCLKCARGAAGRMRERCKQAILDHVCNGIADARPVLATIDALPAEAW